MLASCTPKTEDNATQKAETEKPAQVAKAEAKQEEQKESDEDILFADIEESSAEIDAETITTNYKEETPIDEQLLSIAYGSYEFKRKTFEGMISNKEFLDMLKESKNAEIIKIDKEKKIVYCKQKIKAKSGKIFTYIFKYEWNEKLISLIRTKYKLVNKLKEREIKPQIIKQQVYGEILTSKNQSEDLKKKNIKKFEAYFEEYVKEHYTEEAYNGGYVLDYIKGNFTGSGKDEYIVYFDTHGFTKDLDKHSSLPEYEWKNDIDEAMCFIIDDDSIIKTYEISGVDGFFIPASLARLRSKEIGMPDIKAFGVRFFQGWINDFNQNGINEIYSINPSYMNDYSSSMCFIEFNGQSFNIRKFNFWYSFFNSVDWYKGELILEIWIPFAEWLSFDPNDGSGLFKNKWKWNAADNNYWPVYSEMLEKFDW